MDLPHALDSVRQTVKAAAGAEIQRSGMVPRPQVHLFDDASEQPYVGCLETRDFSRGADAAAAIAALGVAARASPASHLLVVWEDQDLAAALEQPSASGNALVFAEATADDHSVVRCPFVVSPGVDTTLRLSWGATRSRHRAPLPGPVRDLLAAWRGGPAPAVSTPGHGPAETLEAARAAVAEALGTIDPEAVDRACSALRTALDSMPGGDPRRGMYLVDLGQVLQLRYEQRGDLDDVATAIQVLRRAAAYPAGDSPARRWDALGTALRVWYEGTGDRAALDESITSAAAAVEALPAGDRNAATCLVNLASARHVRFRVTGDPGDLDLAISDTKRAFTWLTPDDGRWATTAMTLCNFLEARYALTGDLAVLDEAIRFGRAAAGSPAGADWLRAARLANLARTLGARYRRTGELRSLREGIDAGREAVAVMPPSHPDHARYLLVLSESMRALFERTQNRTDLDAAFRTARAGLAAVPLGHPTRGRHLLHLAQLHTEHDQFVSDLSAVDAAIALLREALETLTETPLRASAQAMLADVLRIRGHETGDPATIDEAVALARTAVADAASDGPHRSSLLRALAGALDARHGTDGDEQALTEAIAALREAAAHPTAPVGVRLDAARSWGHIAARSGRTGLAAEGLDVAVQLLPLLAARGLARADAEFWLARFAGLARDAAALAVADGSPARAAELLELGRTVLIAQVLDGRGDLSALRAKDAALADRFAWLSTRIETDDTGEPEDRRRWAGELDRVATQVRAMPGLERFLLPPTAAELCAQSAAGPVVLVNISRYRCDALLVTPDGIRALPLPDLTPERLASVVTRFLAAVRDDLPSPYRNRRENAEEVIADTLAWLWDTVAGPVLEALGPMPVDRLWWVPTGMLALLPLHAAGHARGPSVLDRSVPSYTPSIRALAHARAAEPHREPGWALTVGMPRTPGAADLPAALRETRLVARRMPGAYTLVGPAATASAVLAAMETSAWAHFACHATTGASPSDSRLLLHDHAHHPLTATAVSRLRLRAARLAYLSACDTAVTATTDLADEVIHIASAFHLAGFPQVIGTLWAVEDSAGEAIADQVYGALTADGPDLGQAVRALHQAVSTLRNEQPHRPSRWAGHVHLGV